jgi:F0F1-type ATP synthase assembly protein I
VRESGSGPRFDRQQVRAIGVAIGFGCSTVGALIFFIVGGLLLDRWLDTTPVFTLIGVLLGLVGAGSQLYRLAKEGR